VIRAPFIAWLSAGGALLLASPNGVTFEDVAASSGVVFRHDNAASSEKYLIETMGAGAAWIDYDNDGFLDIYLVNSAPTKLYQPEHSLRSALYRNKGDGTFTDVTQQSGVGAAGLFGMGVATGDWDNDGDTDLFVTGYDRSILYRNEGDGRFIDVTGQAGVANLRKWGSSAAWFDYDRDGWLDLVIANYVDWSPENNLHCGEPRPGYRSYCHPNKYKGQLPTLYHNKRNGTFQDVSMQSGLAAKAGNGLGVVCYDYNGDGWQDIFIANDSMANALYINKRDGTFDEVAVSAGAAYGENGEAEAGMGVDAGDYDGDGRPDLFITHLDFEFGRLYKHNGNVYEDHTFRAGIGYNTFQFSGFGVRFIDYDNDGWRDIFIANGHILDNIHLFHPKTTYAEPKLVFWNLGGKFVNVTAQLGAGLAKPRVSRAAAFGDYDNDGDIDVLVNNNGEQAELLRNEGGNRNQWIEIKLVGTRSNRDGVGAQVTIVAGSLKLRGERVGGASYQSAHDPRLHFGLGARDRFDQIEVRWPSGTVDKVPGGPAGRVITVKEGGGGTEESAESHDRLGVSHAQSGRLPEAIVHFKKAIELRPEFAEAHYHLALAYEKSGQEDVAIDEYLESLRLQPALLQARYLLAGACRKRGDTNGALRLLEQVVEQAPKFAEARYNLGLLLKDREQLPEAIEQLREAVRLSPGKARVLMALGIALAEQQNAAEALAVLRKAAELDPGDAEAPYNIGLVLAAHGQTAEAATQFRASLALNSKHSSARRALGVSLMHQGDFEASLEELRKAVEAAPDDAEAYNNLGLVELRRKNSAGAIEALERAVRLNPRLIKAYFNLAQAYQREGRPDDARQATEKARQLTAEQRNLGRAMVLTQSARQRMKAGDRNAAISQLREAVTLSPEFGDAGIELARTLREAGADPDEALKVLRGVLRADSARADAHYEMGLTLKGAGRASEALKEFQTAVEKWPCYEEARRAIESR
jgi:tetratricopeptide (TPR) repeat protein